MKRLLFLVALLGLALLLVAPMAALAADDPKVTAIKALADAENKHDANAAVAFYADNAVITEQDPGNDFKPHTIKGKAEITKWENSAMDPSSMLEIDANPIVSGNDVTVKFKFHNKDLKTAGIDPAEGKAWFTFDKSGKISALTLQYDAAWVVKARKAMASMAAPSAQAGTKNLPATGAAADTLTLALPFGLAGAMLLLLGLGLRRTRRLTL